MGLVEEIQHLLNFRRRAAQGKPDNGTCHCSEKQLLLFHENRNLVNDWQKTKMMIHCPSETIAFKSRVCSKSKLGRSFTAGPLSDDDARASRDSEKLQCSGTRTEPTSQIVQLKCRKIGTGGLSRVDIGGQRSRDEWSVRKNY